QRLLDVRRRHRRGRPHLSGLGTPRVVAMPGLRGRRPPPHRAAARRAPLGFGWLTPAIRAGPGRRRTRRSRLRAEARWPPGRLLLGQAAAGLLHSVPALRVSTGPLGTGAARTYPGRA